MEREEFRHEGIVELNEPDELCTGLAADVRTGLASKNKELPAKYFYDEVGSDLFDQICELPEYYQTRTERAILESIASEIAQRFSPSTVVELGSGSASKTRLLLSALREREVLRRFIPIDISGQMLLETAAALTHEYPGLEVVPVVGDFNQELPEGVDGDRALTIFLGGTIGNFRPEEAIAFLRRVASGMNRGDHFLLGVDLIKDPVVLHAAYNDAAGVTARFNLNVLHVVNRELQAEFDLDLFRHYAFYNPAEEQIEMHLASTIAQQVYIGALDMSVEFERGETIRTEISRKFSRRTATQLIAAAGMVVSEFYTDPDQMFALCLAEPLHH